MRHFWILLMLIGSAVYAQNQIVVTNNNDAGPGSLREAVETANMDGVPTVITFESSLSGSVISLNSRLDLDENETTIDGDISGDEVPDITLDGGGSNIALRIDSDDNLVISLRFRNCSKGVEIRKGTNTGHRNIVTKCHFLNNTDGVEVRGASGSAHRNLILENVIVNNETGVRFLTSGTITTTVSRNAITNNSVEGIRSPLPVPGSFLLTGDSILTGTAGPFQRIEAFSDSGFQGATFLLETFSDENGVFSFDLSGIFLEDLNVTATATDTSTGGTSSFASRADHSQRATDVGDWSLIVSNIGSHGFDLVGSSAGGEFPRNTSNFVLFAGGIYVGAAKNPAAVTAETRYAVSQFEFSGDFGGGPILNEGVPFDSLIFDNPLLFDNRLYIIDTTRAGIDWLEWPAADGAPVDSTGNPLLVSDQDSWCVFNDVDLSHHLPDDSPIPGLGIEIRQATYAFTQTSLPGAEKSVLLRFQIENKTNQSYDSVYFAIWADPDVGNAPNDLIGTDTSRNMLFMYNSADENTPTGKQYAMGYRLLYSSSNGGSGARLAATTEFDGGGFSNGDPHHDLHRYYYLKGLDQDGTARLASEGLVEQDGSTFNFPGDPVTGQGLVSSSYYPGGVDFKVTVSEGPFLLEAGENEDVIFALVGGEGDDRLQAVTRLRQNADQIEYLFENYIDFRLGLDSAITLSVDEENGIPGKVTLSQNYPNPFNPATRIRYSLDRAQKVELTVYNILGQKVRTLVSSPAHPAGTFTVSWDGKNDLGKIVSTGVYFYRLKSGSFVQARKMMLLR